MSGVTLCHSESDTWPECTVVFGGGRLQKTGSIDSRRIEISFEDCWFARSAPKPDNKGIEAVGFEVIGNLSTSDGDYLEWLRSEWNRTGICPRSGFYVATESSWLRSLSEHYQTGFKHYVVSGRGVNGCGRTHIAKMPQIEAQLSPRVDHNLIYEKYAYILALAMRSTRPPCRHTFC